MEAKRALIDFISSLEISSICFALSKCFFSTKGFTCRHNYMFVSLCLQ